MLCNSRNVHRCIYGCCLSFPVKARKVERRTIKRRERQAWKANLRYQMA